MCFFDLFNALLFTMHGAEILQQRAVVGECILPPCCGVGYGGACIFEGFSMVGKGAVETGSVDLQFRESLDAGGYVS